jgi:hypothetical protein
VKAKNSYGVEDLMPFPATSRINKEQDMEKKNKTWSLLVHGKFPEVNNVNPLYMRKYLDLKPNLRLIWLKGSVLDYIG